MKLLSENVYTLIIEKIKVISESASYSITLKEVGFLVFPINTEFSGPAAIVFIILILCKISYLLCEPLRLNELRDYERIRRHFF